MLDARRALILLTERGFLDVSEVMNGEVKIVDASRRNRNLHLLRRRGPSYMIKQGLGDDRRRSVANEVAVYAYLHSIQPATFGCILPHVVTHVPEQCVFVTELVDGISLESCVRDGRLSSKHAQKIARAVAAVHLATWSEHLDVDHRGGLGGGLPWGLTVFHHPSAAIGQHLSNGTTLAIRMIQDVAEFRQLLDEVVGEWTAQCLVHGDLRFDNCLVPQSRRANPEITLVDWELAQWGDACWDTGAVVAAYIAAWLLSCPISGETPPEAVIHLARCGFGEMQRAASAFWSAYRRAMAHVADVPLRRTMQFAAVHLLRAMVEELQLSVVLTGRVVCLAQLAHNFLRCPDDAAQQFLRVEMER